MRFRDALREKEWWLLAAILTIVFRRPLTTETFFFRDLYQLVFPKREFLVRAIASHEFPLWDPLMHAGQPYLANPQNTFFYPANALFLFLPTIVAFNLVIVAHFFLCAFGAYWLSRVVGIRPRGALAAGAVYALVGVTLSAANLLIHLFALAWIPIVIGLAHRYLHESRLRFLAVASVAAAMPLLAGAAETTALMLFTLAVWMLACRGPLARRVAAIAVISLSGVGLSLIQTLPTTEMIVSSSRAARRTYADFARWSVPPQRLPEMVIPGFFGRTDTLDERDYWGADVEDGGFPYLLSLYLGPLTIGLAILAAFSPRREESDAPWRALAAIAAGGVLLSLGRYLPLFPIVYRLPLISTFRYPTKAMLGVTLPVALLAARGVDLMDDEHARRRFAWVAGIAGVLLAILAAVLQWSDAVFARISRTLFLVVLDEIRRGALMTRVWYATIVLLLAFVVVRVVRDRTAAAFAIAGIVVADVAIAGYGVNVYAPRALFDEPAIAATVRGVMGAGRFYRTADPATIVLRAPSNDIWWLAEWKIGMLSGYTATMFGIPMIFHTDYDGLAPRKVVLLGALANTRSWSDRLPILRAAGVRAFMTFDQIAEPGVLPVARSRTDAGVLSLYSIPTRESARASSAEPRYSRRRKPFFERWHIISTRICCCSPALPELSPPAVERPVSRSCRAVSTECGIGSKRRVKATRISLKRSIPAGTSVLTVTRCRSWKRTTHFPRLPFLAALI
jgi:hypothetical protein